MKNNILNEEIRNWLKDNIGVLSKSMLEIASNDKINTLNEIKPLNRNDKVLYNGRVYKVREVIFDEEEYELNKSKIEKKVVLWFKDDDYKLPSDSVAILIVPREKIKLLNEYKVSDEDLFLEFKDRTDELLLKENIYKFLKNTSFRVFEDEKTDRIYLNVRDCSFTNEVIPSFAQLKYFMELIK